MVTPIEGPSGEEIVRWHRTFASRFFNHTWKLMDGDALDPEGVEEMLSSAFAQRAHWYEVGAPRNRAIADWQVSRAACLAGFFDLAHRFAARSLAVATAHDVGPFVAGFAHEAIARTAAAVDDVESFNAHLLAARELALQIEDEGERATLTADLDEMSGD